MAFLFDKLKDAVNDVKSSITKPKPEENQGQDQGPAQPGKQTHLHTHASGICSDGDSHHLHRFQSFAPQREGNDAKWYVDGCGYFWAVSVALEQARESIWILDWWRKYIDGCNPWVRKTISLGHGKISRFCN